MDRLARRWTNARRPAILVPACLVLALGAGGCAESWDEVSSRDFTIKSWFSAPPDPLVVLSQSQDGDKRAGRWHPYASRSPWAGTRNSRTLW